MTNDRDQSFPAPDPAYYSSQAEAMPSPNTEPPVYPFGEEFQYQILKLAVTTQEINQPGVFRSQYFGSGDPRLKPPREHLAALIERFAIEHHQHPDIVTMDELVRQQAEQMKPAERHQFETEWQHIRALEVGNPKYVSQQVQDFALDRAIDLALDQADAIRENSQRRGQPVDAQAIVRIVQEAAQVGQAPITTFSTFTTYRSLEKPTLDPKALYGTAGRIVETIQPKSEADPVALLGSLIVGFGNLIGRSPYIYVAGTKHHLNEFICLVGETSIGRKGTSWGQVKLYLAAADPQWTGANIVSGLSSGEGMIYRVRDPVMKKKKDGSFEVLDEGVKDKRLLILEQELASVLTIMKRDGNILNPRTRDAWDHGNLQTLTRTNPMTATNAHISMLAHVTVDDLIRHLTERDKANGYGNRYLWLMTRRDKVLKWKDQIHHMTIPDKQRSYLTKMVGFARKIKRMTLSPEAEEMWDEMYPNLSTPKPGLLGAITGRAEAHVLRLACLYAALDISPEVKPVHLQAALAVWAYAEASARTIFGDRTGNPYADRIRAELEERPDHEMDDEDIYELFGRNAPAKELEGAKDVLMKNGVVECRRESTGRRGRPRKIWKLLVV